MMSIRPAIPAEYELLSLIWLQASLQSHRFVPASFWLQQMPLIKEQYLPAADNYVYIDAQGVAGFLSLMQDTIAALFVAPERQGQGIGYALINYAKQLRRKLQLEVFLQNHQACIFYQRQGFAVAAKTRHAETAEWQLKLVFPAEAVVGHNTL